MWYFAYPPTESLEKLPFYLHSIGLHELQPPIMKPNGHPYDQFFYNTTGSGTLTINGNAQNLPAGCGFFIPAGTPHEYYPSDNIWDVRWMVPCGNALPVLYERLGIHDNIFYLKDIARLDSILNIMHRELILDPQNGNLLASAYVPLFLTEFARDRKSVV